MSLAAIPIADITSRADHFACPYLGSDTTPAIISAGFCSLRQAKARKHIGGDALRVCISCPLGRVVERLSGGPVELSKNHGAQERSRERGGERGGRGIKLWNAKRARIGRGEEMG